MKVTPQASAQAILEWLDDQTPYKDSTGRMRVMPINEKLGALRALVKNGSYPADAEPLVITILSKFE